MQTKIYRSDDGLKADKNFKAMGAGERTSKKVATIKKADGTSFKRKNANQYGATEGGNEYYEERSNRVDKFANGGNIGSGFSYSIGGL
jgi:hypothetical protein